MEGESDRHELPHTQVREKFSLLMDERMQKRDTLQSYTVAKIRTTIDDTTSEIQRKIKTEQVSKSD